MKNKGKGETIFVNRDIYKMNLKNLKKMGKENIFIKNHSFNLYINN